MWGCGHIFYNLFSPSVLKCSWIQLKENGNIWSISLNEVGEEQDGLLMIIIYTSLCIYMLLSWWKFGSPHSQRKFKVKGWNMTKGFLGQKGEKKIPTLDFYGRLSCTSAIQFICWQVTFLVRLYKYWTKIIFLEFLYLIVIQWLPQVLVI